MSLWWAGAAGRQVTYLTVNSVNYVLYLATIIALYIISVLYMPSWAQGPWEQTIYFI